jgi:hypothetical protein
MEPADVDICATLWEISHVSSDGAAKVLWTMRILTVTLFAYGVELGPLPLLDLGLWGKEPN